MKWTPEEVETLLKSNPALAELNGAVPEKANEGAGVNPSTPQSSKYRAIRTEYGGVKYHSKKEASKAAELDLLVKAGELSFYLRQVPFDLGGNPRIIYRADFVTFKRQTDVPEFKVLFAPNIFWIEVIEVKGMWTGESKLKLKLFREKYPMLKLVVE